MEAFPRSAQNTVEHSPTPTIEIEPKYVEYVPQEFLDNPIAYFEHVGKNVKKGQIIYDESGLIREDPTAVKDLPAWRNNTGTEINVVGKRINTTKGVVRASGDPFYEYKILEYLDHIGLPAAKPIAKVEHESTHLIIMERIHGIRWSERETLNLQTHGYSDEDMQKLAKEAECAMNELKERFEEAGVIRKWKLADMVFQIDIEGKKITSVVPTDWEKTKIIEKMR